MTVPFRDIRAAKLGSVELAMDPWLLGVCVAGVLVRALTVHLLPNVAWADETFQYVEQASRLVGGHALVPWEYQVGARSWLLPLLVLPAVALGRLVSTSPDVVYGFVSAEMVALAVAGAIAAYRIGCATASRQHGLFAAFVVSIWCEAIYLSPHPLADSLSANLLLIALAGSLHANTTSRLAVVGAWLGLTLVVRLQLAPALGLIGLFTCGRQIVRRGVPMALGAAVPVLLAGLVDWVSWGAPFSSFRTYYEVNQGGVASSFGTAPLLFFPATEVQIWAAATPLILVTAALGARRLPLAGLCVLVIAATFSIVPHKEYRFLFPAVLLLLTLCGMGTVDVAQWLSRRLRARSPSFAYGVLAALWISTSIVSGATPAMVNLWLRDRQTLSAIRAINDDPAACGVAVAPADSWARTGMSRFRPDIPLFRYRADATEAYNYFLAFEGAAKPPRAFAPVTCFKRDRLCLYRRSGGCDASTGVPLDAPPPSRTAEILHRLGYPAARGAPPSLASVYLRN